MTDILSTDSDFSYEVQHNLFGVWVTGHRDLSRIEALGAIERAKIAGVCEARIVEVKTTVTRRVTGPRDPFCHGENECTNPEHEGMHE